ncbi:zinc ribbon domain-containing protein [Scytonema hofmannii]
MVFECLTNLRPERAKFSRRSNQKRAYWLSAKIRKRTKYKAFQSYGIITALVSPKNTSRHCALCNGNEEEDSLVSRIEAQFSTDVAKLFQIIMHKSLEKVDYSTGAPNYICSYTVEHRGNADLNAARNIGLRFFARYYQKPRLKVEKQGLLATQAAKKAFGMVSV